MKALFGQYHSCVTFVALGGLLCQSVRGSPQNYPLP